MTSELARRLELIDYEYTASRMGVLARLSGNPFQIEIRRLNAGAILMAPGLPGEPAFNRLLLFDPPALAQLEAAAKAFREKGVEFRCEVIPGHFDDSSALELSRLGSRHTGFHTTLYAVPAGTDRAHPSQINVVKVTEERQMEQFMNVYLVGWGFPVEIHEGAKRNLRHWVNLPGWQLYIASIDGIAAAVGVLFRKDGLGYLADAVTLPRYQRQGCQTALIRERVADCFAANDELIVGQAEFGSTSQHNMERVGLSIGYTRAIWTGP